MTGRYESEEEIRAVVDGFESCTTGKDDFSHRSHLTVAVWYLWSGTREHAYEKMCLGLRRFLDHHHVDMAVYNEPLTMAWINVIQEFMNNQPRKSLVELTNLVIERLSTSRIVLNEGDNYSLIPDNEVRNAQ